MFQSTQQPPSETGSRKLRTADRDTRTRWNMKDVSEQMSSSRLLPYSTKKLEMGISEQRPSQSCHALASSVPPSQPAHWSSPDQGAGVRGLKAELCEAPASPRISRQLMVAGGRGDNAFTGVSSGKVPMLCR